MLIKTFFFQADKPDIKIDIFSNGEKKDSQFEIPNYSIVRPVHALSDFGPYKLLFWSPTLVHMLNSLRFVWELRIVQDDGTIDGKDFTATDAEKISIANSPGNAIINKIGHKLCSVPIGDHSGYYSWKTVLMQTYSYSNAIKTNNLGCEWFSTDSVTDTSKVNGNCAGFKARAAGLRESKPFQLVTCPVLDFSSQQQTLAPGHQLELEIERTRDDIVLLCTDPNLRPKIKVLDFYAKIRTATPTPTFRDQISRRLTSATVPYQMSRNVIRIQVFSEGTSNLYMPNMYRGKLPRALYCFFLNNNQLNGSYEHNPFIFKHYNVREASVNINGVQIPAGGLKIDHKKGYIAEAYRHLLDNVGLLNNEEALDVNMDTFEKCMFVLAFDLSPLGDNGNTKHAALEGALSFNAVLDQPLPNPVTLMTHAVFENTVTVNKQLEVSLDYTI